MCGIVGLVQKDDCFTELYDFNNASTQGQDAAGMTVCKERISTHVNSRSGKRSF